MIITGNCQHAAILGGTGSVGVLEHIAAAVNAGAFAIPERKHAIVFGALENIYLLAAPDSGSRQVFIQARVEFDLVIVQKFAGLPQLLIQPAQWRTAIAGDKTGGVQAGSSITLALHHRQADQSLDTCQKNAAGFKGVFIV